VLTLSSDSELSSYEGLFVFCYCYCYFGSYFAGEVEVICEMKPKHMRTPPLVSLDDDDDDDYKESSNDNNNDVQEYSPELITTTTTSTTSKSYMISPRKRDSRRALSESPERKRERRS
jgi:hypothetical protein